jgi:multiple sugar transport system permease protein
VIDRPNPAARAALYLVLAGSAAFFLMPLAWTAVTSLKDPGQAFDQRWVPVRVSRCAEIDGRREPVEQCGKGERPGTVRVKVLATGEEHELPVEAVREESRLHVQWNNYSKAATELPFGRFFLNSIFIAILVTAGQLVTCSLAAYAFARLEFPGRDRIFLLYLGTMMLPGQVTIIPVYLIMRHLHWIDTYQAVVLPGLFSAYGTFLLRQFFLTIPKSLEEAAMIDGCSRFGIYFRVILPLSKPALATLATFVFIGSWNSFFWPFIVLSNDALMTLPVGLAKFKGLYNTQWTILMAATVMVIVPTLVVYLLSQRFLTKGIVLTGLKG